MASLASLMEALKKADDACERMFDEYSKVLSAHGESEVSTFYLKKYEVQMEKKTAIIKEVVEAEKRTQVVQEAVNDFLDDSLEVCSYHSPQLTSSEAKRIRELDDSDDEAQVSRSKKPRTRYGRPLLKDHEYKPQKVELTSAAGQKYRDDPVHRGKVRQYNRERNKLKREMKDFIVDR